MSQPVSNQRFAFVSPVLCLCIAGVLLSASVSESLAQLPEELAEASQPAFQSPDFAEVLPDGMRPNPSLSLKGSTSRLSGVIVPATTQPNGVLSGRMIFAGARHGWVYASTGGTNPPVWRTMRPDYAGINEDVGNLDQMTMFAFYCFNAGATVVPLRPIGHQTNEVVLDNVSPAVTFTGIWYTNTTNLIYYGAPGGIPYHYAVLSSEETATATYTPTIPVAGLYPVYAWAAHGADRTFQLYRINHTGGQSLVRIPHHMVGNGWVYLGTYYFNSGSNALTGSVVVSNLQPEPTIGSVVIADAIRFGNGMGSINHGGGVSTYPREEEACLYWVINSLGPNQSSGIWNVSANDETNDFGVTARMACQMNREQAGNMYKRLYIGFHSNATTANTNTATARGTLALYNNAAGIRTPNQARLAEICGYEVADDMTNMSSVLEIPWYHRGSGSIYSGGNYSEISNGIITNEFDATIIEVAFHDQAQDIKLLLDPRVRNWVARGALHAVIKYMNQFDSLPLNFLPEPPWNVRAIGGRNGVQISWSVPVAQAGSGSPAGYVVYQSADGYGFGNPVAVTNVTSMLLTNLAPDQDFYFRVAAVNAGGESFPSQTVGCRWTTNSLLPPVLFVNGFTRLDRMLDLRESTVVRGYVPPGNTGTMSRVIPRLENSFDYVVQHGKAISAYGLPFDSCHRDAISSNQVALTNYTTVVWGCGQELTNIFPSAIQSRLTEFLQSGGNLMVSGSEIGWCLGRSSGPTGSDRAFLTNELHAVLGSDANTNAQSWVFTPAPGGIFSGNSNGVFDNGTKGIYWVQTPDALTPNGSGARAALGYVGGNAGTAAIQYDGSGGGGRVVLFGFPFETITSQSVREAYMADVLRFLLPARLSLAAFPGQMLRLRLKGALQEQYSIDASADLLQWTPIFTNTTDANGLFEISDLPNEREQFFYRARLSP